MRAYVAQLNPTIGDFEGNVKKILHSLAQARQQGAECIVFSELVICGYPPEDCLLHEEFIAACAHSLERIIPETKGLFAIIGTVRNNPDHREKEIYNTAAIVSDGKLLGYHDKWLLPTYDVFDERRYFEPGKDIQVWPFREKKIGVLICEDIWQHAKLVGETDYRRDPVNALAELHPDVVFNLSSSPYHYQKPDIRLKVCVATAKTLQCPVVLCCQVGGNDQLIFDGYSLVVGGDGKLCYQGKGFVEDAFVIDLAHLPPPMSLHYDPLADLYQALVLGVRDYFAKQGFRKGCLGLSGGIDSALAACIAVDALGKENVLGLSMPSPYSSAGSIADAELLAHSLNIPLWSIPIQQPLDAFLALLTPHFQGKKSDATEENLQARIRGMILMAISNKFGYIVLSTGNKSELGMGYCTLYGDMCGGLSILSDLTKEQVYALSRWINRNQEIIPQSTLDKPPSAELRPNQKDTDTLPPYPVVDAVLQDYVEAYLPAEAIAQNHSLSFDLVCDLIHRIHCAEYKRRQAAPGIRVSRKAFLVGRRYPIVQKWK